MIHCARKDSKGCAKRPTHGQQMMDTLTQNHRNPYRRAQVVARGIEGVRSLHFKSLA